jgi:hypothetical protein
MRHLRGTLARTDPGAAKYFPTSWNDATRDAAVAELNGITSLDDYSQLSDNALRLLPNLPGNEAAFTQVTLEPIEMNAPSLLDNRRPDDAATYVSSFNDIRAYTDTLPGRATNRYLYRAQFVDRAQNVGALSVAGPPVYLRKVEPPRAPVITAVTGGDGQITIQWTANGEEGALKYRVYRANRPEDAIDVRRMAMAHEFSVNEKPEQRELQLSWTDSPLPGGSRFHYRIAVVDVAGNMSVSSSTVAAVVDIRPPSPPVWSDPVWLLLGDAGQEEPLPQNMVVPANSRIALKLEWRSLASGGRVTVTRKARYELSWRSVATLVNADATSYVLYDDTADPRRAHTYRIFAISSSGIESLQANAVEVGRLLR